MNEGPFRDVAEGLGRQLSSQKRRELREAIAGKDIEHQQVVGAIVNILTMVAVRAARAVVPVMIESGGGAIVNISAMSARHYLPNIAHYSAQKVAEAHFTKNLALQFGSQGIRANAVMPGWVMSEQVEDLLQERMREGNLSREEAFLKYNDDIEKTTYCGRGGEPVEYANVIAFLISEKASYVNGAWLNVDGGSQF